MEQATSKLTVRLPTRDLEFAKSFATAHGLTVTEVIDRYLRRMRALDEHQPSPELEAITGLVPGDMDAEEVYRRHVRDKHKHRQ